MSNSNDIVYVKKELKKVAEGTGPQEAKDFAKKILDVIAFLEADNAKSYYEGKADGLEIMAQTIFGSGD